jgi:hypothetical protein
MARDKYAFRELPRFYDQEAVETETQTRSINYKALLAGVTAVTAALALFIPNKDEGHRPVPAPQPQPNYTRPPGPLAPPPSPNVILDTHPRYI